MKKYIFSIVLVCGLTSLVSSCSKDDSTEETEGTTINNSFKAKVDGNNFSPNLLNSNVSGTSISFVGASSTSGQAIGLFMPTTIAPGSYPTSETGDYRITYTSAAEQNNLYSAKNNGTIVITSNNTSLGQIKGTFAGNATHTSAGPAMDTVKITAGEFVIKY